MDTKIVCLTFFSIRVESTQVSPIVKFLHPVYRSSCAASRRWIGFNWNCKNKLSFAHLLTLECFKDEGEWNGKTRRRLTDIFIYSLLRSDDKSRTNIWLSMHWNEELGCKCLKTENPSSRFFTLNHFRPLFRLVALNLPCAVLMLLLLLYWCMISILKLYPLSTRLTRRALGFPSFRIRAVVVTHFPGALCLRFNANRVKDVRATQRKTHRAA